MFVINCGKIKPPKHILLPFAVKALAVNTEILRTLNCLGLGHRDSYSQIEETDTALCIQKLERAKDEIPLPTDTYPGVFTTLAWDNIDRLEETLSGGRTSHRISGIAVQPQIAGHMNVLPAVEKSKKRSISPAPTMLPTYMLARELDLPKL